MPPNDISHWRYGLRTCASTNDLGAVFYTLKRYPTPQIVSIYAVVSAESKLNLLTDLLNMNRYGCNITNGTPYPRFRGTVSSPGIYMIRMLRQERSADQLLTGKCPFSSPSTMTLLRSCRYGYHGFQSHHYSYWKSQQDGCNVPDEPSFGNKLTDQTASRHVIISLPYPVRGSCQCPPSSQKP